MNDLIINPAKEKGKIVTFLQNTFQNQGIDHAVIGLSGGIDSTVSFFLLKEVLPPENIFIAHLYYFNSVFTPVETVVKEAKIPQENIYHISIKKSVDEILKLQNISSLETERMRI